MEQDNQLKEILQNGATLPADDFTDRVMKIVTGLPVPSLQYQPLVSVRLQKVFMYLFAGVVILIVALCGLVAATGSAFINQVITINYSAINYNQVLVFIGIFWLVFTCKILFEKKFIIL